VLTGSLGALRLPENSPNRNRPCRDRCGRSAEPCSMQILRHYRELWSSQPPVCADVRDSRRIGRVGAVTAMPATVVMVRFRSARGAGLERRAVERREVPVVGM